MSIQQEKFKAIADKIRQYLGIDDLIKPNDFASKIDDVYDKGKQSAYDEFWDRYQSNGNRVNYQVAFGGIGWNAENFKPKYSMRPTNTNAMFQNAKSLKIDLAALLKERNIILDTSGGNNFQYFTLEAAFTRLPTINCSNGTNLTNAFSNMGNLITFDKWIISTDGNQKFSNTFASTPKLEKIAIEGVVGENLSFSVCPLTKESIMGKPITAEEYEALSDTAKTYNVMTIDGVRYYGGVITALKDDATGKTLTLKKTAKETAFTDEEWITLITTKSNQYDGNWTISLV